MLIGMRKDLAGKGVTGVDEIPGDDERERGVGRYGADGRRD